MENASYSTSVKFNESVLVRLFVCKAFDISLAAHSWNCTRASHAAKGTSAEYPKHVTCDKDCIYIYVKCTLSGSLWSHTQLSNIREIRLIQCWKSDTSTQVCRCPSHVHPRCRPHRAMPHFVATLWTDAILSTATKHSKLWLRTRKDQMLESTQFLTQIYLYYPIILYVILHI